MNFARATVAEVFVECLFFFGADGVRAERKWKFN